MTILRSGGSRHPPYTIIGIFARRPAAGRGDVGSTGQQWCKARFFPTGISDNAEQVADGVETRLKLLLGGVSRSAQNREEKRLIDMVSWTAYLRIEMHLMGANELRATQQTFRTLGFQSLFALPSPFPGRLLGRPDVFLAVPNEFEIYPKDTIV
jgi:hypothetical protein